MKFLGGLFNSKSSPQEKALDCLFDIEILLQEVSSGNDVTECLSYIKTIKNKIN